MAEYVVKMADERGRIQEQVQIAGSAEELRSRFSQAGYYVYSVRPRGMRGVGGSRKKANLEAFIIFNQQFLTLIRAGLPILKALDLLSERLTDANSRARCHARDGPPLLAGTNHNRVRNCAGSSVRLHAAAGI